MDEDRCRMVYVVSPYAGDTEENRRRAVLYSRFVIQEGKMPVTSHLLYPQILDEGIPEERELGMRFGLALLDLCGEVWVFGPRVSPGMEREISEAHRLGKPVRYLPGEGTEA